MGFRGKQSLFERSTRGLLAVAFVLAASLPVGSRAGTNVAAAQGALIADMASSVRTGLKEQMVTRDAAPLWAFLDPDLEDALARSIADLGLEEPLREKKLAVALVDTTDLAHPRVAALNGDTMLYAASLPKIAVMLGVYEKAAEGKLVIDDQTHGQLQRMIRRSSNPDATALMQKVGLDYIARTLIAPRYRLYDPRRGGGLWAGKDYAQAGLWRRDPLQNLAHAATAMQVARFYYLLETGNLVSPEASAKMKQMLSNPGIEHKFVAGLATVAPQARLYRKSGTWAQWHSDSAIVEHDGRKYIAVALAESPAGGQWMREIIVALDRLVLEGPPTRIASAQRSGGS